MPGKIVFYLGLCLGMQVAVIDFAQHVCDLPDAMSVEFDPNTIRPVIHLMNDQALLIKGEPCVWGSILVRF